MNNLVVKKNFKAAAEIKTMSDYAIILEHCNGYSRQDALEAAQQSFIEPLFVELFRRNLELFKTGSIILQ